MPFSPIIVYIPRSFQRHSPQIGMLSTQPKPDRHQCLRAPTKAIVANALSIKRMFCKSAVTLPLQPLDPRPNAVEEESPRWAATIKNQMCQCSFLPVRPTRAVPNPMGIED